MNKTKTKKLEMVLMDRPLLEVSKLGGSERSTQGQIGFCELLTVFGFARHTIIRGWHDGTPCDFNVFMSRGRTGKEETMMIFFMQSS